MVDIVVSFSQQEFQYLLMLLLLAASGCFYFFVHQWKRLRFIADTPTTRLRSAHQGYVEVIGKGQGEQGEIIYAPLSNHPCLWFDSRIDQQQTFVEQGRTQTCWNAVYRNTSDRRFQLIDGNSHCYVDPGRAEVAGGETLVWYGNTAWPDRVHILESQSAVYAVGKHYRYSEQVILPGQCLYILGQYRTLSATKQSVREVMIDLLNGWKEDQTALKRRFDSDGNGRIDQAEWEVARRQAFSEAQQRHAQSVLTPDENILARPDDSRRPFIISTFSQTALAKHYRRNAYVALSVCVLLTGIAMWMLSVYGQAPH